MSAQAFLDKFKILKGISGLKDEESLYLLCRGLTPHIMSLIYGSNVAPPDNYKDFITKVRKIALNLDINYGYQHASGSSIDHPLLRITEPEQELHMVDQDAPWRLTPWAHNAITVESSDKSPTSVQAQNEKKGLASNVDQKII